VRQTELFIWDTCAEKRTRTFVERLGFVLL